MHSNITIVKKYRFVVEDAGKHMYILAMVTPTKRKIRMRCSSFSGLLSVTVVTTITKMHATATTVSMSAMEDLTRSLLMALITVSVCITGHDGRRCLELHKRKVFN